MRLHAAPAPFDPFVVITANPPRRRHIPLPFSGSSIYMDMFFLSVSPNRPYATFTCR